MIVDFGDIKREIMVYDHKLLLPKSIVESKMESGVKYCYFEVNGQEYKIPRNDCILMNVKAVTCEEMCDAILRLFMMYENVQYARVKVWETNSSNAESEWERVSKEEVKRILERAHTV